MLALLHERRLGDASAFAPWLALLPDQREMELHHPLMWDRETRRRSGPRSAGAQAHRARDTLTPGDRAPWRGRSETRETRIEQEEEGGPC